MKRSVKSSPKPRLPLRHSLTHFLSTSDLLTDWLIQSTVKDASEKIDKIVIHVKCKFSGVTSPHQKANFASLDRSYLPLKLRVMSLYICSGFQTCDCNSHMYCISPQIFSANSPCTVATTTLLLLSTTFHYKFSLSILPLPFNLENSWCW